MARPRKCRQVCALPEENTFGPHGIPKAADIDALVMSVDAYETIRLIDHEGLTQEACALQMGVARTTVQGIYAEARKILAKAIVEGRSLVIAGGDYTLCDERAEKHRPHCCRRHSRRCARFNQ